jgi:small subunit ribosomal protein S9
MSTISGLNIPAGLSATPVVPGEAPAPRPLRTAKPADRHGWWWGTGRRKSAVARVRLKPAKGVDAAIIFEVDRDSKAAKKEGKRATKTLDQYFAEMRDRNDVTEALRSASLLEKMHVVIRCHGGGTMGQAQACRLGIARALLDFDPTLEARFREMSLLTRDSREVERKKYGQAGARRRFQFSKR